MKEKKEKIERTNKIIGKTEIVDYKNKNCKNPKNFPFKFSFIELEKLDTNFKNNFQNLISSYINENKTPTLYDTIILWFPKIKNIITINEKIIFNVNDQGNFTKKFESIFFYYCSQKKKKFDPNKF